jgi:biotin operon repressor
VSASTGAEGGQRATVRRLLIAHGTVSAHELTYEHGITRTAARIWELRQEGLNIVTHNEHGEQAEYELVPTDAGWVCTISGRTPITPLLDTYSKAYRIAKCGQCRRPGSCLFRRVNTD